MLIARNNPSAISPLQPSQIQPVVHNFRPRLLCLILLLCLPTAFSFAQTFTTLLTFDEAIEVAQQISALDPDDVLAHTSLSILYQKKGMVPEAEAEANKARILGWKQQLKKS